MRTCRYDKVLIPLPAGRGPTDGGAWSDAGPTRRRRAAASSSGVGPPARFPEPSQVGERRREEGQYVGEQRTVDAGFGLVKLLEDGDRLLRGGQ
ncbi:hypothetical protein [Streptomyces sp. NPDC054952]